MEKVQSIIALGLLLTAAFSSLSDCDTKLVKCPELLRQKLLLHDPSPVGDSPKCNSVKCDKVLTKEMCPPGTIFEHNFALCKCCPSCVTYLKPGDKDCVAGNDAAAIKWTLKEPDCNEANCVISLNTCLPGLVCNDTVADTPPFCQLPEEGDSYDIYGHTECQFRQSLYILGLTHWDPHCEADGSFSQKQCKGNHYSGECFCANRQGERLFGREWRIQAEDQICACSRKVYELRQGQDQTSPRYIASLHCTSDGNYEPLQCNYDLGICHCVDKATGRLDGSVVPLAQWEKLPCYPEFLNMTKMTRLDGAKYLRHCDSEFVAGKLIENYGKDHGTKYLGKAVDCDYDGSYAPTQKQSITATCVFKNGTKIRDYSTLASRNPTCNCGRDVEEYYPSQKKPLRLSCQQNTGNFDTAYDFGSYASCMDKDGFLYGHVAESKHMCCLSNEGCSTSIKKLCHITNDGYNDGGVWACFEWPFQN